MWVYWLYVVCYLRVHQSCLAVSLLWVCDCIRLILLLLQVPAIEIEILTYLSLVPTLVVVDISSGQFFGYLGQSPGQWG